MPSWEGRVTRRKRRRWSRRRPWMRSMSSDKYPACPRAALLPARMPVLFVLVPFLLWFSACAAPREQVRIEEGRRVEYGLASWYGADFHGKLTANGEVYDMYKISAAHKTLPLGSRVRVTNQKNGKSVVLRINDRGPFVDGRIIDLSYAAASLLGMADEGVVPARVETIELGDNRYYAPNGAVVSSGSMFYTVQVGSFQQKENALTLKSALESRFEPVFIREWNNRAGLFYRVRVGKFSTEADAEDLLSRLLKEHFSAFVTAE
ncbi:MAG: septal ring lytic transglycosylase RlpA family lipoprotein [Nitrospirae bacterium CG08_land_8_20_14_0_20_52_24]|nr:MAG: septal ring lytic transglycosylase RlpA family lipoprotein [Nitrospirae bacterium CG08_land_8_20_14_0_20_52_24]PIV85262.1 MAG: septal ring lytic transglycosylase RlpA family lipoprotein [Nitrospirae bacterium CG17_big_fil_post_rev_8_21_14_2_50_50_9]PIW84107.1 MAG: septal ring lytic transglycosylase RlpA family lipoprotein [Nitrospirae bacterium CG_4_8_14_3_um_filter_50_41]PIX86328.1 MAG: septal ring lytic transglycosylase RlpA family lipoprotein [Nitrospirae bacterium CG_4_10_14_3_um_fil